MMAWFWQYDTPNTPWLLVMWLTDFVFQIAQYTTCTAYAECMLHKIMHYLRSFGTGMFQHQGWVLRVLCIWQLPCAAWPDWYAAHPAHCAWVPPSMTQLHWSGVVAGRNFSIRPSIISTSRRIILAWCCRALSNIRQILPNLRTAALRNLAKACMSNWSGPLFLVPLSAYPMKQSSQNTT